MPVTRSTDASWSLNLAASASIGVHRGGSGLGTTFRASRADSAARLRASDFADSTADSGGGVAPDARVCHARHASVGAVSLESLASARLSLARVAAAGSGVPSGRSRCRRSSPRSAHATPREEQSARRRSAHVADDSTDANWRRTAVDSAKSLAVIAPAMTASTSGPTTGAMSALSGP